MKTTTIRVFAAAVLLAATPVLASCGSDSTSDSTADTTSTTEAVTPVITVTKQWARTSPTTATTGAAYMTIEATADDQLVGAMVDASIAKMAEIHEMAMVPGSSGMGGGTMAMQKVDKIDVKAGTPLELKVGGYHIMLMELAKPLETGTTITVTLTFAKAGEVAVEVPVLEDAPE